MKVKLNTKHINRYIKLGLNDRTWFEDTTRTLTEIFGSEQLWFVCQLLAATSMNSTLKSNITLFKKAYIQIRDHKKIEGYVPVMEKQIKSIASGGELSGEKINNFARAMFGDPSAVVVDMWLMRAFGMEVLDGKKRRPRSPDKKTYAAIKDWVTVTARKMNITPSELSSIIWKGCRSYYTGKENPSRYCDFLKQQFTKPLFENEQN